MGGLILLFMKNTRAFRGWLAAIFFLALSLPSFSQQITKVATGEYLTTYLTSQGRVHGAVWTSTVPVMRDYGISNVVDIDGAQYTNVALTSSGQVYVLGVTGSVSPYANLVATDNRGNPFVGNTKVYGFYQCYLSLRNGTVWYWGIGDVLNYNNGQNITAPVQLVQPPGKTMVKLVPASSTSFGSLTWLWGLASDGTVWEWNRNNRAPRQITFPGNIAEDIAIVGPMAFVVKTSSDLFTWGHDPRYAGGASQWEVPGIQSIRHVWEDAGVVFPIKEMAGNYNTLHIIDANNNMFASGSNPQGNIGNGVQFSPWRVNNWQWNWSNGQMMTGPVQIPGKFKNIITGNTITFYLYVQDMGNDWYSWGRNKAMSLGNGKTLSMNNYAAYPDALNVPAPTLVTPLTQTWSIVSFQPDAVQAPLANAGVNQYINTSTTTLYGSGSSQQDGTLVSFSWKKVTGGPATISNTHAMNTTVTGLSAGTYRFSLTVTNNRGETDESFVTVVVSNVTGAQGPAANAGEDIEIYLPENTATLTGSVTSGDAGIAGYQWTKVSGPSGGNIQTPTQSETNIINLQEGTYVYQLMVTADDGLTGSDLVQVVVRNTPNQAPRADAGNDQEITLPANAVTLSGSGQDGDGTIVRYNWSKISGPDAGTFSSPTTAVTQFYGMTAGTYVFSFKVIDNDGMIDIDRVTVIVNPANNTAPVANAGEDMVLTFPNNTTNLNGNATDPDGNILGYRWTQISGPALAAISNVAARNTGINRLVVGTYVFRLTVTDRMGASHSDEVTVMVRPASSGGNQAPVANAGEDMEVILPRTFVYLNGSAHDPDGRVVTYRWWKLSGPENNQYFRLAQVGSRTPLASGLKVGTYKFLLRVTDNHGAYGYDTVSVVVKRNPETLHKSSTEPITGSDDNGMVDDAVALTVYPNPVQDVFSIKVIGFEKDEKLHFRIFNQQGMEVKQMNVRNQSADNRMNIEQLPAGMYILQVTNGKKKATTRVMKISR